MRTFLDEDPVGNSVVWNRVFQQPDYRELFVEAVPPKAVLVLAPPRPPVPSLFALHATDLGAADRVMRAIPSGPAFFHLTNLALLERSRPRATEMHTRPAWLFRLEREDFVDMQRHDVRPVTPERAPMIAKLWEPDWPSESYVRSRIVAGPTFGVYVDGELVAWDMTHFETDTVVMMGFLHALEGHRGKGYAKSTASALVKEILRRGKIPACHVYEDNEASIRLTEGLGFKKIKMQVWADAVFR